MYLNTCKITCPTTVMLDSHPWCSPCRANEMKRSIDFPIKHTAPRLCVCVACVYLVTIFPSYLLHYNKCIPPKFFFDCFQKNDQIFAQICKFSGVQLRKAFPGKRIETVGHHQSPLSIQPPWMKKNYLPCEQAFAVFSYNFLYFCQMDLHC